MHEFGHFAVAFALTRGPLLLSVGKENDQFQYEGKRVRFSFSFRNGQAGQTTYSPEETGLATKILILSGGPFLSLGLSLLTGWLTFGSGHPVWIEIAGVSWFCANALAFFRAAIPMRLRPTEEFPEGPPSDGLQLIRLLGDRKKEPRN